MRSINLRKIISIVLNFIIFVPGGFLLILLVVFRVVVVFHVGKCVAGGVVADVWKISLGK